MKKLVINRFIDGSDWTIGEFRLLDEKNMPIFLGFTLEPAGRDSVIPNMDKRVPAGIYSAKFTFSPKFNTNLPVIFNEQVSQNRRILIHSGNTGINTEGCILVGNEWAKNFVYNSKATLNTLLTKLGMNDFEVEIINGEGLGLW